MIIIIIIILSNHSFVDTLSLYSLLIRRNPLLISGNPFTFSFFRSVIVFLGNFINWIREVLTRRTCVNFRGSFICVLWKHIGISCGIILRVNKVSLNLLCRAIVSGYLSRSVCFDCHIPWWQLVLHHSFVSRRLTRMLLYAVISKSSWTLWEQRVFSLFY